MVTIGVYPVNLLPGTAGIGTTVKVAAGIIAFFTYCNTVTGVKAMNTAKPHIGLPGVFFGAMHRVSKIVNYCDVSFFTAY